jgi:hypothetical protein
MNTSLEQTLAGLKREAANDHGIPKGIAASGAGGSGILRGDNDAIFSVSAHQIPVIRD